jgi:hypothetical protein
LLDVRRRVVGLGVGEVLSAMVVAARSRHWEEDEKGAVIGDRVGV